MKPTYAAVLALHALLLPSGASGDADGNLACGPTFAIYDAYKSGQYLINLVPFQETSPLAVSETIALEGQQPPNQFIVTESRIIARTFEYVHVYQAENGRNTALLVSFAIDGVPSSAPINRTMVLDGDLLKVYGRTRSLDLALSECTATACVPKVGPFVAPPATRPKPCDVRVGGAIFSEIRASSGLGDGIIYHDVYLVRRKAYPRSREFAPNSVLVVGSRIETID